MTATTAPDLQLRDDAPRPVGDALTMAWRNLLNIRRNPQLLVFATIQPVIFVLMFRYVFGGAIAASWNGKPVPYVDFLMPGIFVQTVTFGALTTGVGLAEDLEQGSDRPVPVVADRPLGRAGRPHVGRPRPQPLRRGADGGRRVRSWVGGSTRTSSASSPRSGLVLAFAYSLSWLFAIVGLSVPDAETAQAASFPLLAPLVFASSAFVPVSSMPGWLQVFANHQPVTAVVNAARALTLGGPVTSYLISALAWIVGIIVVCAPLAVRRYRRAT